MSEPEQLEVPLSQETEQQESLRIWRQSQTSDHLAAEARDYTTLSWSMRMAAAIEKTTLTVLTFTKDRTAGTLRHSGNLQDVVLLLNYIGHQRCSCRREFEEGHDLSWGLNWVEADSNHKEDCIPAKARRLLMLLEEGE